MRDMHSGVLILFISLSTLSACLSNPTPHPGREDEAAAADTTGPSDTSAADSGGATGDVGPTAPDSTPPDSPDAAAPDADASDGVEGEVSDDAGPDAGEVGDAIDDGAEVIVAPPEAFPPTDREVLVRDVVIADLDGDGVPDLLLTSTPTDRAAEGVYVFFGAGRTGLSTYDLFVPTHARPDGVRVVELDDNGVSHLAVIGARRDQGWFELYPYVAASRGFGPSIRTKLPTSAVPDGGAAQAPRPVALTVIDTDADGVRDIVSADHDSLAFLAPPAWDNVSNADWSSLSPLPPWAGVVAVAAVPGADGRDWLVVLQEGGAARFFASGQIGTDPIGTTVATNVAHRGAIVLDLDGDGRVEAVGFEGDQVSITRFDPPEASALALTPLGGPGVAALAAGDFDGSGAVDLAALEVAGETGSVRVKVLHDVAPTDVEPAPRAPTVVTLPDGARPAVAVAARFDGDASALWLLAREGQALCYRWDAATASMVACEAAAAVP